MSYYKHHQRLILFLVFSFVFCSNAGLAQTPDDKTLVRTVASNFLDAYQRKDVDSLIALWSSKGTERETFIADYRQMISLVGNIEMKDVMLVRVSVEDTSAILKITLQMHATDLKSGKPATGFGQQNRTLRLVKEDGQWKVSQYEPSERELATKLLSAKTESDQKALLDAEPALITSDLVQALRKQAETLTQRRELSQALIALQLTRSIAERIGDEQGIQFAVNNLGINYYSRGEYQQALELFEQNLSLEVVKHDPAITARTLINIGMIKRFFGDNAAALDYVQRGQLLAEQTGDKKLLSSSLNNIGIINKELGNYARALEYFERGLALSEGDKITTSLTLNNIGTIYGSQGNHSHALEYFQRALKLGQSVDDKYIMANALNNIGLTYQRLHDYPRALENYQQSLALSEQLNDKRLAALTLNNIGRFYRDQDDHKRALDYYQQSLAIREKLNDTTGMAYAFNHIGFLHYLQGDYEQALQFSSRSIDIATRLVNPDPLWEAYELSGRAHTSLKQFDEAEKDLTNSINVIEKMRYRVGGGELERQRFFEDKVSPYTAMVELAFNRNRPVDALTYGELAKARTLLDVLRNGRIPINKAMSREEQEKERTLNAELTALNVQLYDQRQRPKPNLDRIAELEPRREQARMAYEAFLTGLYVKYPELKVQRGEASPITEVEAAALIPDASTAIVEFVVAEDKSYLIVLTRDRKITLYSLNITSNKLSERVDEFRRMLAERDLRYQDAARQLYDLLLKPAEEQLRGRKTLCIVPDGALWELPFQALQPRTGVHLIEDHTIFYAPSLSVLREETKQRSAATLKTLLAFGNPNVNGQQRETTLRGADSETGFGPLPEAEKEVKTLARLYGTAKSNVFIGAEAREAVVKTEAPKYEVLHFATHGLLDNRNPMFSYLIMAQAAGDANEDGLLEAREIINMDLHAKLAVLSACQTARGWVGAGEGVIGMSWALFVAGVPTIVASQWKVDSASTTSLMIDFHRRLTMRRANPRLKEAKAEALRQASLQLLRSERYRHPFYWAGFVMIGDGW
ncbi:MAG TPA: CHAT domain-containing protein [Pyrinomonadaceae bacterium]|nr:CHAT domain-containing protein [Pyrinomonadaceae bacterium]